MIPHWNRGVRIRKPDQRTMSPVAALPRESIIANVDGAAAAVCVWLAIHFVVHGGLQRKLTANLPIWFVDFHTLFTLRWRLCLDVSGNRTLNISGTALWFDSMFDP